MAARSSLDVTRSLVLAEAETWIGTPYRHQASRKGVGCDCLGLVRGIWRALHGAEPEMAGSYAADWSVHGSDDRLLAAARRHFAEIPAGDERPGDVLLFRWRPHLAARHIAVLAPLGQIIHAYEGHAVCRSALVPQWRRRIAGTFHFPPTDKQV